MLGSMRMLLTSEGSSSAFIKFPSIKGMIKIKSPVAACKEETEDN